MATERDAHTVLIGLSAAIVSVTGYQPCVLAVHRAGQPDALPFGPFDPLGHRTLESGLRSWVKEQTYLQLGYVEQLYTFGDRGRHLLRLDEPQRIVSVGYLALTRPQDEGKAPGTVWREWYEFFPWEDWRQKRPPMIEKIIRPRLTGFIAEAPSELRSRRRERVQLCFGLGEAGWDEEKVLDRYELLYEAGLVEEAARDGRSGSKPLSDLGQSMAFDHRRILATAMGRLRGKMKYRPVVFELMPPEFTLLELQRTVEAISGIRLHKQNFRRLVENQGLVEESGRMSSRTGGRPARQYRFRREVLRERPAPGLRMTRLRMERLWLPSTSGSVRRQRKGKSTQ
ncbi:MAG: NUDIX hydrolase [Alphaproteobacteria bacterium]